MSGSEEKAYFFISGLPRSGSTMLSAILRQNPLIEAGMTSPVGSITAQLRSAMAQNREIDALIQDDDIRRDILKGVFDGYYARCEKTVVFDTNRGWAGRIPELRSLFGSAKMIAMVRNPAWILDSVERITRKNPLRPSSMIRPGSNIDSRAAAFMSSDGLIGNPLGALREAVFGPDAEDLLVIEYEALCESPGERLDAIYDFVKMDRFHHDFTNLSYQQEHFDAALRTPGLHTVQGEVKLIERKTILPPNVFNSLTASIFWRGISRYSSESDCDVRKLNGLKIFGF